MSFDLHTKINEGMESLTARLERISTLLKPEWDARRDTAKTLISLSGATLVFTITFSQSVIKPDTPIQWRYAVVGCWLGFIISLVCCLASLWFSMTLPSLPVLIKANEIELRAALEGSDPKAFMRTFKKSFMKLALREAIALWSLRLGIIFYGLALSVFTAIGLRQLLH